MAEPGGTGIIQRLRLILDKAAADKVKRDLGQVGKEGGKELAEGVEGAGSKAMGALRSMALRLAAALAAAFAIAKMVQFGRESLRVASESRQVWSSLGVTLRNVGINLADVRGEIDALAESMEKSNVDDEATARILDTLVQFSGDYAESLRNVQLVADLAAAKQMDLGSAASLVGKIMSGNAEIARRYIGDVAAGTDVMELMRQKFDGQAEAQSKARGGMDQLRIAWSNLQEAVGNAMHQAGGANNLLDVLTGIIKALTRSIENNQEGWQAAGNILMWFVRIPGAAVLALFASIASMIAVVTRGLANIAQWKVAVQSALGNADVAREAKAQADALHKYANEAERAAKAAWDLGNAVLGVGPPGAAKAGAKPPPGSTGASKPVIMPGPKGPAPEKEKTEEEKLAERIRLLERAAEIGSTQAEAVAELARLEDDLKRKLQEGNLTLEQRVTLEEQLAQVRRALGKDTADAAGYMAETMNEAFRKMVGGSQSMGDALTSILEGVGELDNAFDLLGKDAWKNIIESIKKEAKGEAIRSAAHALMQTAFGFGRLALGDGAAAGRHFAAAKFFAAAAIKWGIIAGAAGAIDTGAGGGGASAAGGGDREVGGATLDQAPRTGAEIHIHVDQFDPNKPSHARLVGEAAAKYQEVTGGTIIYEGASR